MNINAMDHMSRTEELLTQLGAVRQTIKELHASPSGTSAQIAAAYDEVRNLTATAKVHATLAVAQAVQDRSNFRALAQ